MADRIGVWPIPWGCAGLVPPWDSVALPGGRPARLPPNKGCIYAVAATGPGKAARAQPQRGGRFRIGLVYPSCPLEQLSTHFLHDSPQYGASTPLIYAFRASPESVFSQPGIFRGATDSVGYSREGLRQKVPTTENAVSARVGRRGRRRGPPRGSRACRPRAPHLEEQRAANPRPWSRRWSVRQPRPSS